MKKEVIKITSSFIFKVLASLLLISFFLIVATLQNKANAQPYPDPCQQLSNPPICGSIFETYPFCCVLVNQYPQAGGPVHTDCDGLQDGVAPSTQTLLVRQYDCTNFGIAPAQRWYTYFVPSSTPTPPAGSTPTPPAGATATPPSSSGSTDINLRAPTNIVQGNNITVSSVVQFIFNLLVAIGIVAALAYLLYGGVRWITSAGDKAAVENARNHIVAAIIGLLVLVLSFVIVSLVLTVLGLQPLPSSISIPHLGP